MSSVRLASVSKLLVYCNVFSQDWRAKFPLDEWVAVKQGEEVHVIKGCSRTLVYNKVEKLYIIFVPTW